MNTPSVSRRHVLATFGVSSLAGCASLNPLRSETGVRLGSIFVYNPDSELQSVQLELRRESEIVYEGIENVADGHEIIDPSWSTESAEYTLLYATDDELGQVSIPSDYEHVVDSNDCYYPVFTFSGPQAPEVELHTGMEDGSC